MKKNLIIIVMSLMASVSISAQSLGVQQRWQFNLDALRTLESYENCSALYGNAARMDFDMLFKDRSMHIFNDLNGLSAAPTLSVHDYSELLSTRGRSAQVIIKNLKKSEPYYDGAWKMDVSFDKEITYANVCGILFSSKNFFGADFHIRMTLEWDEEMRECTIEKLDGERGSEVEMLPQDYSILTHSSERDADLRVNGDTLQFNTFGQAFLSANPVFKYPDSDVRVKTIVEEKDCNIISLKYVPKRWRLKANYSQNIGDFYVVDRDISSWNKGSEMSIELGYIFPSRKKAKLGFFFGAGLAQTQLDLDAGNFSYGYNASSNADEDADSYVRYYDIKTVSQSIKLTDLFVPVYFDLDLRFSKYFSLYFDAGAKLYLNMKNELTINSGTYTTWGYYPQYNIVMRPENNWNGSPINGFVSNESIQAHVGTPEMEINQLSVDALGKAGFRILLYKNVFLDFGASYQMSVLSPCSNQDDGISTDHGIIPQQNALMTYSLDGGEKIRGFHKSFSSFNRQFLSWNVALMFRF